MISKIKDLFNVVKYRRRYNTLENKYNTLKDDTINHMLKALEKKDGFKSAIKKHSEQIDELNKRIIELERRGKSGKIKNV